MPNGGNQQTCSVVADFDNDGINDFAIGERSKTPSFCLYLRNDSGWKKYVIDDAPRSPEAGACVLDVDNDGNMDIVAGNDYSGNQVWWYENPAPDFSKPWKRRLIKDFGLTKHHDICAADFDNDGKRELVFWNQGAHCLYFARIPADPKDTWDLKVIYRYDDKQELPPRASYKFNGINEHEGFDPVDMDRDGVTDLVGGGMWFRYEGNDTFSAHPIDEAYHYSRCAAGQLVKGGRPEVVLAVGDGTGPMNLYRYDKKSRTWHCKTIVEHVDNAHSLRIIDFDNDGNPDIWYAEMRLNGGNPASKNKILFGDGKGNFPREAIVSEGIDNHESKIADLDGDGDPDILGKGYDHLGGNLNIWLQNGTGKRSEVTSTSSFRTPDRSSGKPSRQTSPHSSTSPTRRSPRTPAFPATSPPSSREASSPAP